MPGLKCCVVGCKNGYYNHSQFLKDQDHKKHPVFSMYCFPPHSRLRKLWIKRVRLKRDPGNSRVCVVHFSEDQFENDMEAKIMGLTRGRKLKEGAIPDRRLHRPNTPERKRLIDQARRARLEKRSIKKDVNDLLAKGSNVETVSQDSVTNSHKMTVEMEKESCPLVLQNSNSSTALSIPNSLQDKENKHVEPLELVEPQLMENHQPEFSFVANSCPKIKEGEEKNQNQPGDDSRAKADVVDKSVEDELERMFLSPAQPSVDDERDQILITDHARCSNCDVLRQENQRLKLQLSFFQSKLTHVVEIYHQAEERALSQLRNKYRLELEKCRKANEEMKYKNARYLALLRAVAAQDKYEERVTDVDNKSYWTQQEISDARALREISQEAYTYVKDNMNVILPDLSNLEETSPQNVDPSNCITINTE